MTILQRKRAEASEVITFEYIINTIESTYMVLKSDPCMCYRANIIIWNVNSWQWVQYTGSINLFISIFQYKDIVVISTLPQILYAYIYSFLGFSYVSILKMLGKLQN